jgi:hypothetical protein
MDTPPIKTNTNRSQKMINTEEVTKAITNQLDESYIAENLELFIKYAQDELEKENQIGCDRLIIKPSFYFDGDCSLFSIFWLTGRREHNLLVGDEMYLGNGYSDPEVSYYAEVSVIIRKIKSNAYCIERKGDTKSPNFIYIIENHKTERYLMQDYLSNR